MKILIWMKQNDYLEQKTRDLKNSHPEVEVYTDIDRAPIEEVDILLGGVVPSEILKRALSLKLILVPFTGVNHLPLDLFRDRGTRVANSHANGIYVAERAVGMLLSLLGRITDYHNDLRQELWHGFWGEGGLEEGWISLRGKTVGIMGTGGIGLACARLLRPFGCRLLGFRRSALELAPFDEIIADLDEALARSDIIILALPLTQETRGILNAQRLSSMEGKYLVNVARGPVVEEEALYKALSEGRLAGAALDVWYTYPEGSPLRAPSRFPIHKLKNVLLSPHIGGYTREALRRDVDGSFANLAGYLATGKLVNEVRLDREY